MSLALQDVDIKNVLQNNSECKAKEFQEYLTNYQKESQKIVRGSYYEVEIYKNKLRQMEKQTAELERKTELVVLNQKFNNEIIEDFIHFKKLAEVCSDSGGYYDPCNFL